MKYIFKQFRAVCYLLAAGLTIGFLPGCQPAGPEAALELYLQRLAGALEMEVPPTHPTPIAPPPRPGELQVVLSSTKIDTLDFLALSGCELQVNIGRRNSSLGRAAAPSQKLLLDLEFLRLAPECIAYQRQQGRIALAATLEEAWQMKEEQLPAAIFNATLAGTEYRQFWRDNIPPGEYPAVTGSQVVTALNGINALVRRWLDGDYRADNLEFEILLGEVATGDGGSLLSALVSQATALKAADDMLHRAQADGPLCGPGYRSRAADILPNVVRKFLAGGIQPHSAALEQRRYALIPPVRELEALLRDTLSPQFRHWRKQRDNLLEQAASAPRRHVTIISAALAPC